MDGKKVHKTCKNGYKVDKKSHEVLSGFVYGC